MKVGVIFYHKDVKKYNSSWLKKCVDSILNQSYNDFSIYELNYGGDGYSIFSGLGIKNDFNFYNRKFINHAEAMNYLFDLTIKDGIDILFNTNVDDYYEPNRFEVQIQKIKEGYDLVSSNFKIIGDSDEVVESMTMHRFDFEKEFEKEHNIIAHPSVCWSKNFIKKNRYDINDIPREDFKLWKKTFNKYKFFICEEYLLNYRKHLNQITSVVKQQTPKNENVYQFSFPLNNQNIQLRCRCGEVINKVKYNFCPKCNIIY